MRRVVDTHGLGIGVGTRRRWAPEPVPSPATTRRQTGISPVGVVTEFSVSAIP